MVKRVSKRSRVMDKIDPLEVGESVNSIHGGCKQYRTGHCTWQDSVSDIQRKTLIGRQFTTSHYGTSSLTVKRLTDLKS